jgi:hypothetical protein
MGAVAMAEKGIVSMATRVPCAVACSASSRNGSARASGFDAGGPFCDPILIWAGLSASAASNSSLRAS